MHTKNLPINCWAENDRPREKMLLRGSKSLTNAEILAILIGSGNRKESAVELCRRILHENKNDLALLHRLSPYDLMKYEGIGEAKAISILAALELATRREVPDELPEKIVSSKQLYQAFAKNLKNLNHEEFWVIYLKRDNTPIDQIQISKGGTASTSFDVKQVARGALERKASGVALCHNHPSGNLRPSQEDISLTKKTRTALEFLDLMLIDHIIFTDNGYFSFVDEAVAI